jgi:hypothetical protein
MRSSPGFGSSPYDKCAINARFHYVSTVLPAYTNRIELTRWLVLQKARCHPDKSGLQLFVSIWFQILFHLPHRDAFHLSLTVLVHYRSHAIFSLGSVVLPSSNGISPVPSYLSQTWFHKNIFTYRAITFYGRSFQRRLINTFAKDWRLFRFRSPLLTESLRFLFLLVLRCFNSQGSLY